MNFRHAHSCNFQHSHLHILAGNSGIPLSQEAYAGSLLSLLRPQHHHCKSLSLDSFPFSIYISTMTVLRSREIGPSVKSQSPFKALNMGAAIEPTTPAKTLEPANLASPGSNASTNSPGRLGLGSGSVSVPAPRRSLRPASVRGVDGISPSGGIVSDRKRKYRDECGLENVGVPDSLVTEVGVSGRTKNVVLGELDLEAEKGMDVVVSGGMSDIRQVSRRRVSNEKGKGKRKLGNGVDLRASDLVIEDWEEQGLIKLRSGKKVSKRRVEGSIGGVGELVHVNGGGLTNVGIGEGGMENKSERCLGVDGVGTLQGGERYRGHSTIKSIDVVENGKLDLGRQVEMSVGSVLDKDQSSDGNGYGTKARRRLSGEEKGKGQALDGGLVSSDHAVLNTTDLAGNLGLKHLEKDPTADGYHVGKSGRRLSREEKGKGKVVEDGGLLNGSVKVELGPEPNVADSTEITVSRSHSLVDDVSVKDGKQVVETKAIVNVMRGRDHRERFRDIARKNATRFAHFASQEVEENGFTDEAESEMPGSEADGEVEDWPGPFSTAMKIIRDRKMNSNVLQKNSCMYKSKPESVIWVPKKDQHRDRSKLLIPSLQDLCLAILSKNADAITSLDSVPDILRHKLSQLLCNSGRMNSHFLELLVHGSPTEIRIRPCSYFTEEQVRNAFEGCETNNLTVLQLDLCGCCMPDYVLNATLARSSNSLPALTTISLKGAYRLSDVGLSALVMSAPALRSINLSECSLITSEGINIIADSLGMVLRELYIDDCQNIDAVLILPALLKVERLAVLSVARNETVCDDFLCKFIAVRGHHVKELVLTDCKKLSDSSLKVIADNCNGLCALDLVNLHRLTDSTMGYLANGCRALQTLKLRRNFFSDEAIAAYLEASGESLRDLSLNTITKVSHNTAVSLARCSRKLLSLDLSWCRNLTDEALGLIVDSCLSLEVLNLHGCTQITNVFLDGHSNPQVQIIGLKFSPILQHLKVPDPLAGPLHYSSVSS